MQIKEIKSSAEIDCAYGVLLQQYENLTKEEYLLNFENAIKQGYIMAGVFEENKCLGVVGVKLFDKVRHGKVLEIEDFMIDRKKRGIGVGKMLIKWVEWQKTILDCKYITGNLDTKRKESQAIYAREGFVIEGLSFRK